MRPTRIRETIMKKALKVLTMVLFVVGLATMTSCNKDKEDLIVGKWQMESITLTEGEETMSLTVAEFASIFGEDIDIAAVEFKSDGTMYELAENEYMGTYTVEGDKLTVVEDDEAQVMTIKELTSSKLVLEGIEYDEDYIGGALSIAMTFKRV